MTSLTKQKWEHVASLNIKQGFTLGPINAESLLKDPKHLCFTLSRYKFAAKLLADRKHVLEIGCGEGLGAFFFCNESKAKFTGVDFDKPQIEYAQQNVQPQLGDRCSFLNVDLVTDGLGDLKADGAVMLDVIEHLHPDEESKFFEHSFKSLEDRAVAVIGTPNLHAHAHASKRSQEGHINMFEAERLKSALMNHFSYVNVFSMNDEMVHTGYSKMAHYLMALAVR